MSTPLTEFLIDLQAKANSRNIDIASITVSEDHAKLIVRECPGSKMSMPPKGSKEPMFTGEIMGMKLYVRPNRLTPKEQIAFELRSLANAASSFSAADSLNRMADAVEKL